MEKEEINAPISQGEKLGVAEVYYSGEFIGKVDLVATNSIESSFWATLGNAFGRVVVYVSKNREEYRLGLTACGR